MDTTAQKLQALAQQGKVPPELLAQFETFRSNWQNAAAATLSAISSLQIPSPVSLGERAATALGALQALKSEQPLGITHQQIDPAKLPHRRSDIPRRALEARPAITPGQLPPGPADLAPTIDVPITAEIRALAAQLNSNPVDLFAVVRNTIEFQPYFGSLKGAQGTLLEKAGNDLDQASLLIALLRASNVPARYVAGVVELPIEKVMNWVGVQTPQAAVEAIASNGIPSEARTSADGTITHLLFFHVWAEAFLPQGPGRGAASRSGWVQLDPSFKQHEFTAGIDLTTATGFDATTFLQGVTSGATINEPGSFFTHLNEPFIDQELTQLSTTLLSFVQTNLGPNATVGDVLGIKTIKPITRQELNTLSQSFPFQTFTPQFEFVEFPQSFRHLVNFAMAGFSKLFALPELAGKRVTVTYVAATPADQALIDAFGGILNVFPAFIVNLKPQLKVEGQLLAEGQGVPLGSSQILRSAFRRPLETGFDVNDKIVTTGADHAISFDFQRVSLESVQARMERFRNLLTSLEPTPPRTEQVVGESLHVTGLAYWAEADGLSETAAKTSNVIVTREPSEAVVVQGLRAFFFLGLPLLVRKGSVNIDVKRNIVNPVSSVGDRRQEVGWMLASGTVGSAAEHGVFEQLYRVPSVSTIRILELASSRGIPIFTVDRTNLEQILPQLETFPSVTQNIRDFVNAGFIAIVPQHNMQVNAWFGMGWIVVDLNTGAAGYFIAGVLTTGADIASAANGRQGIVSLGGGETSEPTGTAKLEDCVAKGEVRLNVGCFVFGNALAFPYTAFLAAGVVAGVVLFARGSSQGAGFAISAAALLSLTEVGLYNSCQESACQ